MAMKLIIDTDAVLQRMALKDITEVRNTIDSTLTAAHAVLQGILNTPFEPTSRVDLFYLNAGMYPASLTGMCCCKLGQAFVWDEEMTIIAATTRANITESSETVTDFVIDHIRGYILVPEDYLSYWISVTYKAGFDSTHKAPYWLQEAVLAYMPHMLAQPSSTSVGMVRAANEAAKIDFDIMGKMVEPYLRNRTFTYSPLVIG